MGFPDGDTRVQQLADALWGKGSEGVRRVGKGRVLRGDLPIRAPFDLSENANWIWKMQGTPTAVGTAHFAKSFHVTDPGSLRSAAIQLVSDDGSSSRIATDGTWNASPDGFVWAASRVLGKGPMAPWGLRGPKEQEKPTLYPSYQDTMALLKQDGVEKVFSSDGNLRFHQRRTADRDIFFVANRDGTTSSCTGVFRTDGSKPELWDPANGRVRSYG